MRFSIFTPCGQWRLSNGRSRVQSQYEALKQAYGDDYDYTPGTHMEATVYAKARALARVDNALIRAGNQRYTNLAVEGLANREADYEVVASPLATIAQRQAALTVRAKATQGAILSNILASLRALLGSAFLGYRTLAASEVTIFPVWPSSDATLKSKPTLPNVLARDVVLADVVTVLGSPITVPYANLDPTGGEVDLVKGDQVIVDPGSSWLSEVATVTAVAGTGAGRTFTATFQRAHDVGAVVSTRDWPYEWSTQAFAFIVVDPISAVDPEVRRTVNEFMARVGRGVWQWAVVATNRGGTSIGPFTVGSSPLGATPLGTYTFTPAP